VRAYGLQQQGGQLAADLGVGARSTRWRAWGGRPELFSFHSAQLFLRLLYLLAVCSDNLTPPPLSSKKCVGREKLSYRTNKSNISCLYSDNARSHYQSSVVLNVLQIQSKEVAIHCYVLPVSFACRAVGIGKAGETLWPLHFGLFSEPSSRVCVRWREPWWGY